jgi:hypothetical protein
MAVDVVQYRSEFVALAEYGQTKLRMTTTTEHVRQGASAVFLVSGTSGDEAVTRGVDGLIPVSTPSNTQYTATLQEWHSKERKTDFDIFKSQGNQRKIMQMNTIKRLNRRIDADIITELSTGTVTTGGAVTGTPELILKAQGLLAKAEWDVTDEENIFCLASPALMYYMNQFTEFTSADYVDFKPFANGGAHRVKRWNGINFIPHPRVSGKNTAAEKCVLYHRDAIGHAFDMETLDIAIGYNDEDAYSWARASNALGSKKLQNSGIVIVNHDGSVFA